MREIVCSILSLLLLGSASAVGTEQKADTLFKKACDSLAVLEFERAYEQLDKLIKAFPESEEAQKAKVMKLEISSAETIANEHHWQYFWRCVRSSKGAKYLWFEYLWAKSADEVRKSGDKLVKDAKCVLPLCGKKLSMELRLLKTVDAATSPPSFTQVDRKQIEFLKRYEIYSMFTFVNMLTLDAARYSQVGMVFTEPTYGSVSHGPSKLAGEVNWANLFLCAGEALCFSCFRWKDNGEEEKAREAALVAKELFEKAAELSKDELDRDEEEFINGRKELLETTFIR